MSQELLIRAARVAALSQEHDRAVALAGQALASIDSSAASGRSGVLRSEYARILWAAGRFEPAHEMLREAAQLVEATGTVADRARVLSRYATLFWWRGRFEEEVATAREAVEAARQSGLRAVEIEALDALGNGLWFTGSIREAIQRLTEARQAAVDSGSVEEQLFVSDSLAECLVDADHLEEALAVATLAEEEGRRHGIDRPYGAMFRGNAGLALFCLGRWAEAEALTDHGMDVGHGRVWGLSVRARLLAAMGRAADSRAVMAAVEAMFPEGLPEALRLECALPAAELRLMDGDAQGALDAVLAAPRPAMDVRWPASEPGLGWAAGRGGHRPGRPGATRRTGGPARHDLRGAMHGRGERATRDPGWLGSADSIETGHGRPCRSGDGTTQRSSRARTLGLGCSGLRACADAISGRIRALPSGRGAAGAGRRQGFRRGSAPVGT